MRAWSCHRGPLLQRFCPYKSVILGLPILFKMNYPVSFQLLSSNQKVSINFFVKKTSSCQFEKKTVLLFQQKVFFVETFFWLILDRISHSIHTNTMGLTYERNTPLTRVTHEKYATQFPDDMNSTSVSFPVKYLCLYNITWLLWAFPLVVDREILEDTHRWC